MLAFLVVAGCGGSSDSSSTITYRPFKIPIGMKKFRLATELKPKANGLVGRELKPIIPDSPPPEFFITLELIDGQSTPIADEGDQMTIQYVGVVYDTREKFASSWDEGKPFTFTLGKGELIQALEEGVARSEIGERKEVVIPPDLATGGSRMHDYPSGETLVYMVDVLDVKEQ